MKSFDKKIIVRLPLILINLAFLTLMVFNLIHVGQEEIIIANVTRMGLGYERNITDPEKIERILDFVNVNVTFNDGKFGFFRASPNEILNSDIGGQCGEFSRLTIVLLNRVGIPAHRVYLFSEKDGTRFSNHVLIEFYLNGNWYIADPLYNFVFRDKATGEFYSLAENDKEKFQSIVNQFGGVSLRKCNEPNVFIHRYPIHFENLNNNSRIHWARLPASNILIKILKFIFPENYKEIPNPGIFERPYLLKSFIWGMLWIFFMIILFETLQFQYRHKAEKREEK